MWGLTYGWGGLKGESPVGMAPGERRMREMSEMTGLPAKPAGLDESGNREKKHETGFVPSRFKPLPPAYRSTNQLRFEDGDRIQFAIFCRSRKWTRLDVNTEGFQNEITSGFL